MNFMFRLRCHPQERSHYVCKYQKIRNTSSLPRILDKGYSTSLSPSLSLPLCLCRACVSVCVCVHVCFHVDRGKYSPCHLLEWLVFWMNSLEKWWNSRLQAHAENRRQTLPLFKTVTLISNPVLPRSSSLSSVGLTRFLQSTLRGFVVAVG